MTRFEAALDDWPMELATPPLASIGTERIPPEIVTGPVKVFAVPVRLSVPLPTFVRLVMFVSVPEAAIWTPTVAPGL